MPDIPLLATYLLVAFGIGKLSERVPPKGTEWGLWSRARKHYTSTGRVSD